MVTKQAFNLAPDANRLCDGALFKRLLGAGLVWLEQHHDHVNRLNVFPVPDGDTGTNMLHTMRAAYQQIETSDELHVGSVLAAVAYGATMGARGNSGTILSQIWKGIAETLRDVDAFDAAQFSAALTVAVREAYKAVQKPTEGTILTVARETSEALAERIAEGETDLVAVLKSMVFAARASLRRTPDLLPILRQAGTVDSGGQGLVYIIEGMHHYLTGRTFLTPIHESAAAIASPRNPSSHITTTLEWKAALVPSDEEGYGYDVQFRMHGTSLNVDAIRQAIENIGWSAVVVGTDRVVKVHVHVHDPGKPLSYAISLGVDLDDIVVENMQFQYQQYVEERAAADHAETAPAFADAGDPPVVDPDQVAVIAVVPGAGLRQLFQRDLGAARVVTGGQTMNPSTGDFLGCIRDIPNRDIILLPNNKNIILAAQQAADLAADEGRRVLVVPTRSIPQGVSAMLTYTALRFDGTLDDIAAEMNDNLGAVITAEVTTATRSVDLDQVSVQEGQFIGMLQGSLVTASYDMLTVIRDLLRKAQAEQYELITLYYGSDTNKPKVEQLVETLRDDYPDQTFEIVYGGQALYPYIISIE